MLEQKDAYQWRKLRKRVGYTVGLGKSDQEKLLKIVIRKLKCISPQLVASGGGEGGEGLSFL